MLQAKGAEVSLEATIADVIRRDEQDSGRDIAPLRQAEDALAIDSTGMSIDEVVSLMEAAVQAKIAGKER